MKATLDDVEKPEKRGKKADSKKVETEGPSSKPVKSKKRKAKKDASSAPKKVKKMARRLNTLSPSSCSNYEEQYADEEEEDQREGSPRDNTPPRSPTPEGTLNDYDPTPPPSPPKTTVQVLVARIPPFPTTLTTTTVPPPPPVRSIPLSTTPLPPPIISQATITSTTIITTTTESPGQISTSYQLYMSDGSSRDGDGQLSVPTTAPAGETKTTSPVEPSGGRQGRRRRMEIQQLKFLAAAASDVVMPPPDTSTRKRRKVGSIETIETTTGGDFGLPNPKEFQKAVQSSDMKTVEIDPCGRGACGTSSETLGEDVLDKENSRFGLTVVCGRRRDLEDAVAVKPSFCRTSSRSSDDLHFYGVYDGHGCSHVAMKCKDRMHEIVKEEVVSCEKSMEWREAMVKSFSRMDKDITDWSNSASRSNCRCELQTPQCDAVGSTAVVAVVTPEKIVVSNCGDSRAVLCRNGVAIPLSVDHKPDRPDELARIEEAGGRVIYWDGARVLGVLAMSRAIGDNYLKPYVIPEPEVTVTERTADDECLILASDGLWDVVSNDVACSVASMCLRSQEVPSPPRSPGSELNVARGESSDKACSDASVLLTKLALARRSTDNVSVVVVDLRRNL
ncbi:unnamed protein product [Lactuca saligna]|uniref:protein-serine/threonine phosphatase n=1 Tax=Lactuca saligna TaxID=75948 RepID=A0AA35YGP4_LACSI|nr:unnamed protein product [Lactuca saligna]